MYTQEQQRALEQFDALAAKLGSQNKACAQVGISAAVMSPLKKGIYAGDANAQIDKLISYFRVKEEAATIASAGVLTEYVPTSISRKVYDVIRNCQLKGGLAVACGDAGIGKTMAAKRFLHDHPNDTIYVALNPCLTTVKSLLKILCNKMNISDRTNDEMWLSLANKLRDGMVIVIDEAQHCPIRTLEALRALTDYFAEMGQTLGIAFIGNTEDRQRLGRQEKSRICPNLQPHPAEESLLNRPDPPRGHTAPLPGAAAARSGNRLPVGGRSHAPGNPRGRQPVQQCPG